MKSNNKTNFFEIKMTKKLQVVLFWFLLIVWPFIFGALASYWTEVICWTSLHAGYAPTCPVPLLWEIFYLLGWITFFSIFTLPIGIIILLAGICYSEPKK